MGSDSNKLEKRTSGLEALFGAQKARLVGSDSEYPLELQSSPPCSLNCPAGVNAKAYVCLISTGKYEAAYDVVTRNLPFPGVCGRVCTHPCEESCYLKDVGSVPIKELKRFAADYVSIRKPVLSLPSENHVKGEHITLGKKVAVVGAGPAGLTAASDLARLGYAITVFESHHKPGGILTQGIPGYRLPERVVDYDIEIIRQRGVTVEISKRITTAQALFDEGYDAVILAAGTMRDLSLPIPGIDKEGVIPCLPFLRYVNFGEASGIEGKMIVLGGGSSAFDCARSAHRLGAEKVTIVYRRTEAEMPANSEEIQEAREEGIEIQTLAIPIRVLGNDRLNGMEFLRTELGDVDDSGRPRPIPVEGSEFILQADVIITAIGFTADVADFSEALELSPQGTVKVDSLGQSSADNIFAAGDAVTGPSSVVAAIASGHDAAYGVHLKLSGEDAAAALPNPMPLIVDEAEKTHTIGTPEHLPISARKFLNEEVNLGFNEITALKEACRCVKCGSCFECMICLSDCTYNQVMGTVKDTSFLIKSTNDLSRKIYEPSGDWKIVSEKEEQNIHLETLTAEVDPGYCIACGRCEESCAYQAVRVEIKKESPMAAHVNHDICRGCGACTGACPTGAISQGPMSRDAISRKISVLARKNQPAVFSCIWGRNQAIFSEKDLVFMCTRMIRPATLIEALAEGIPGVVINPCHEDAGCHYRAFERSIEDVVSYTNGILTYIGVDPSRIRIKRFFQNRREKVLDEFINELKEKDLKPISIVNEKGENRIADALNMLMALLQNSDVKKGVHVSQGREDTVGYLVLVHMYLRSEGFGGLPGMVNAIERILGQNISDGDIAERTIKKLVEEITVPEAAERQLKIGLIPSGADIGLDADHVTKLLEPVSKLKIVVLKPKETFSFDKLNSRAKVNTLEFLKKAQGEEVDVLVPLSVADAAILTMFTRTGSWIESGIQIMDIFSLITELSDRGGGGQ
jgi:NADPH-dependent glutamate synthase beta subunit-like oxidoreductase/coenzyme F420-reducing hydrogenase delta subunit/Pyruvate/2-oxoacid:ferredoxin oxidoreductase delta subunit